MSAAVLCPPRCASACAWPRWPQLADPYPFPASWQLAWLLVGLPEPLPRELWGEAVAVVARHHGARAAADGLAHAAEQPAMAPALTVDLPPLSDGYPRPGRWWTSSDAARAQALAVAWRAEVEAVSVDE